MAEQDAAVPFHRDPLQYLARGFAASGDAFWLPGRQLCVGDPAAARAVLVNGEGLYEPHSDFFHTRKGLFGPREAQERIGRSARSLLRAYLAAHADELPETVSRSLGASSEWPDAGNHLIYRHLAPALVTPDSPASLRRTLDEIVERSVLAGARQRRSWLSQKVFRFRALRELARAVEQRRRRVREEPADLLDAVVDGAPAGAPAADLGEVFVSFVFAVAGSVGFTLGWSVYLLGTEPRPGIEPAWVVREALRLWPVAWMLARRPARGHQVAGHEVHPEDQVVACPYVIHRNPRYWDDPAAFRPERWATIDDHQAFLPFGWGPHRCVAAALSLQLVEDVLRLLLDGYQWSFTPHDTRPCVGPALAPPRFTLGLAPHGRSANERR
jgi:cytochrome P450